MKILRSCVIAFSMYSKIPVPQFDWKEEDMKYVFCFFPCIGAVIGLLICGWGWICRNFHIGSLAYVLMGTAIPILVTGGFHVDGYMDTMDALHSYQDRERKLEILKDSHIGAFSVIMLLLYYLIYLAAFSEVIVGKDLAVVSLGFVLSRIMSGLGAVCLRPAKKDGLLRAFSKRAAQKNVAFVLFWRCWSARLQCSFCLPQLEWLHLSGREEHFCFTVSEATMNLEELQEIQQDIFCCSVRQLL